MLTFLKSVLCNLIHVTAGIILIDLRLDYSSIQEKVGQRQQRRMLSSNANLCICEELVDL